MANDTRNETAPNPVVNRHYDVAVGGGVVRTYANGIVDAIDGVGYSLSPGFESVEELRDWSAKEFGPRNHPADGTDPNRFYVRIGQYSPGTVDGGRLGTAKHVHVDARNVEYLSDEEIEAAIFYSTLGTTNDGAVRLLRREALRRALLGPDVEKVREILTRVAYEAMSDVVENSSMRSGAPSEFYNQFGFVANVALDIDLDEPEF